jgi:hypothetical protein
MRRLFSRRTAQCPRFRRQFRSAPFTWSALHPSVANAVQPDLANGNSFFFSGSCGACHASPSQKQEARLGGLGLVSDFGALLHAKYIARPDRGIGTRTMK